MKEILQNLVDSQLEDLAGARIQGQLCVQDSFVNVLLQPLLQTSKNTPKATSSLDVDPSTLLSLAKINTLRYETAHNKTMITIDLAVAER